ncbi:MAG: hypothetical protein WC390_08735 [Sulfurimonas sp.]|jgi:hypothetical protein
MSKMDDIFRTLDAPGQDALNHNCLPVRVYGIGINNGRKIAVLLKKVSTGAFMLLYMTEEGLRFEKVAVLPDGEIVYTWTEETVHESRLWDLRPTVREFLRDCWERAEELYGYLTWIPVEKTAEIGTRYRFRLMTELL